MEDLEEKIANIPQPIKYDTSPVNKKVTSSNIETKPKGNSNKRKKKVDTLVTATHQDDDENDEKNNFSFSNYSSNVDDLSIPKNKRNFALFKTISLCQYAQQRNELLGPKSMYSSDVGNGHNNVQQDVVDNDYFNAPQDDSAPIGMCFAGITTTAEPSNSSKRKSTTNVDNKTSDQANKKVRLVTPPGSEEKEGSEQQQREKKEPKYTPKVLTLAGNTVAAALGCTQV